MENTLLVTDDSMIIREMIKDVAVEAGWRIVGEAADGQEAIDRYRTLRPTAVTLDLVMPDFDGLHGLKGIRAFDPDAQVLLVSAIDQKPVLKEAIAHGAADFIVKPFEKARLTEALQALAKRSAVT
jgi:two-component system chemotaxis response regulator CheY